MELLAPAGSFDALRAAVENGANAVYLGGKSYSARASAANFSNNELREALDYCHIRGVRVYVTVNTLLREDELFDAFSYLSNLYLWGVDAVIVQDLGLVELARQDLPELKLHGSTQMTLHNAFDLKTIERQGIERVVLARELSAAAIKEIHKQTPLELETFVHGALCLCYSGQCLMSSLIGGRSGNRGQCAQPCRQPYALDSIDVPGEYVLSPKDLSLISHLDLLREAGVTSLKIEGRLKSPDYVGVVVRTYRAALDGKEYNAKELNTVFNRGFTTAYLQSDEISDLITYSPPLREARTGSASETYRSPKAFRKIKAHLWAKIKLGQVIELNLMDEAGSHLQVLGDLEATTAENQALSEVVVREKLLRLGNDPLEIVDLQIDLEQGLYLPISELNQIRRKLVHLWEQARLKPYQSRKLSSLKRTIKVPKQTSEFVEPQIAVTVSDLESAKAAIRAKAQLIYFSGQVFCRTPQDLFNELTEAWKLGQEAGIPVFVHLERITENRVLAEIADLLPLHQFDGALVGNFGSWELLKRLRSEKFPIHTDWSFNTFNSGAANFLAKEGASLITAALELQLQQISKLCQQSPLPISILAHGPLESMVTKHCIFRDQGCRYQCQTQAPLFLKDKKGFNFPIYFDRWCNMHIFNSRELSLLDQLQQVRTSGVRYLRIEGRLKEPTWVQNTIVLYRRGLAGERLQTQGEFTKGHYFRGVL